jgi:hypothetical protein
MTCGNDEILDSSIERLQHLLRFSKIKKIKLHKILQQLDPQITTLYITLGGIKYMQIHIYVIVWFSEIHHF